MSDGLPPRGGRVWWLFGLLGGVCVLLSLGGDGTAALLRYERAQVLEGEYWRLASAHLVHGSLRHLLLNLAGLGLIGGLFAREYSASEWLWVLAASVVAIAAGFVFCEPQLQWYVGLSGVLHGALAAGAVAWWRHEERWLAATLTAVLVGKLAWEQLRGALPLAGDLPVIVDAHLYGAVGGAFGGLILSLTRKHWLLARRSL